MRRAFLRALPITPLTEADMQALRLNPRCTSFIRADRAKVDGQDILIVNVYLGEKMAKGDLLPACRAFLSKSDYISEALGEKRRWLTGSLQNVMWMIFHESYKPAFLDTETIKHMAGFLLCDESHVLKGLCDYQSRIIDKRRNQRHAKIMERTDAQLSGIPDLPADLSVFVDRQVVEQRYLVYTYQKGKKQQKGFCTGCQREVELHSPKHGQNGSCPFCGVEAPYKAALKSGRSLTQRGFCGVMQPTPNGTVARLFMFTQAYTDIRNPECSFSEFARLLFCADGSLEEFVFEVYPPRSNQPRWCPKKDDNVFYDVPMYPYDEAEVFKGTKWQFWGLKNLVENNEYPHENYSRFKTSLHRCALALSRYPQIEYLQKMGLTRLVSDIIYSGTEILNTKGRTPMDFLGLCKQHVYLLKSVNGGLNALKFLQRVEVQGKVLSGDEGEFFLMSNDGRVKHERAIAALRYTTPHKAIRYIKEQILQKRDVEVSDWIDYIEACEKLKYDMRSDFVIFPRNLEEAHDDAVSRVDCGDLDKEEVAYAKLYPRYVKAFEYTPAGQDLCVIVPQSLQEIVRESYALRHCVRQYAKRVADQKTVILFVRRQSDPVTSFYTLEIQEGQVRQCRGMRNAAMSPDVKAFVEQYESALAPPEKRRKAG